mgnify:CR=1 FL=1
MKSAEMLEIQATDIKIKCYREQTEHVNFTVRGNRSAQICITVKSLRDISEAP